LVAEENLRPLEGEVRSGIDDLFADRSCMSTIGAIGKAAGPVCEQAVEDAAIEADGLLRREAADAHLRKLLLDLTAQVLPKARAGLDREEEAEVAQGDVMHGPKACGAFAHIVCRAAGGGLDQRIGTGLEVQEGVESLIDDRVGKTMELGDRAFGEVDVEQTRERLMDMREHIGGGHQLPGIAPPIIDAEEGFFLLSHATSGRKSEKASRETERRRAAKVRPRPPHAAAASWPCLLGRGRDRRGIAIDGRIGMALVLDLLEYRRARGRVLLIDEIVADHPLRAFQDRIDVARHIEPIRSFAIGVGQDQGSDRFARAQHGCCRCIDQALKLAIDAVTVGDIGRDPFRAALRGNGMALPALMISHPLSMALSWVIAGSECEGTPATAST
jgi:hypothetical protein